MISTANIGCAVRQLWEVHWATPLKLVRDVANAQNCEGSFPFIIFADNLEGNGKRLAAYIIRHKLGKLVASDPATNHTGREVAVWVWTVDWERTVARAKASPRADERSY